MLVCFKFLEEYQIFRNPPYVKTANNKTNSANNLFFHTIPLMQGETSSGWFGGGWVGGGWCNSYKGGLGVLTHAREVGWQRNN